MAGRFSDVLTYALSVALALGVAAFAAYKVDKLSRMENPPANMGLNFPPLKRRVIMEEAGDADPLITRSTGLALEQGAPARAYRIARSFDLLAVVEGVALVAVESSHSRNIVPVKTGEFLPGGFRVDEIARRNGRWVLKAGSLTLEARPAPAQ
ncbi:hypothetical protein [Aestuariivirga sp.]|uniref:hypothetical protein n=1 Tax=Aestuariivirga sp. TaxID=2650926 RepID=UPI003919CF81